MFTTDNVIRIDHIVKLAVGRPVEPCDDRNEHLWERYEVANGQLGRVVAILAYGRLRVLMDSGSHAGLRIDVGVDEIAAYAHVKDFLR